MSDPAIMGDRACIDRMEDEDARRQVIAIVN